jgi:hypothetical protein
LTIMPVLLRQAAPKEHNQTTKPLTKTPQNTKARDLKNRGRESPSKIEKKQLDDDLDRELADSFPASDPPSVTQPAPKPGGPERDHSAKRDSRSR